jgi:anti-sigma regulatory factor (Ser/Thr protein kinase)
VGQHEFIAAILDLALAPTPTAPSRARAAISAWLKQDHGDGELVGIAQLLVSELVSNGLQHGHSPFGGPLQLRGRLSETTCRVELWNMGTQGTVAAVAPRNGGADGGFGLIFVVRLSDAWGVERDGHGTTVWFELSTATRARR